MTKQLKPCPFCEGVNLNLNCDDKRLMCDTVECNGCGALVPSAEWNTRADGWISVGVKPELHQAVLCKTEYSDGTPAALIRHWNGKSGFLGEGGKKDRFVKGWMPLPSVE
ncbi:MAG: hypothetical protein ACRCUH_15355 [Shewanella sp.]